MISDKYQKYQKYQKPDYELHGTTKIERLLDRYENDKEDEVIFMNLMAELLTEFVNYIGASFRID